MEREKQNLVCKLVNVAVNVLFGLAILIVGWLCLQVFVFSSFRIPSRSMEPELTINDYVLVLKPIIGPRIFNVFASLRGEQVAIYRLPGFKRIKRNDVLIFNNPYPESPDTMQMHILKYYVKRCIGIPGDTLSIQNGYFRVKGVTDRLGHLASQEKISKETKEVKMEDCFPHDSIVRWNMKNFGPMYIPGRGDSISLDMINAKLYKQLIEWETQADLRFQDSCCFINGVRIEGYRFKKNYYFMAGDNGLDSQDSRHWGLVPENFIVGKVWLIWKSYDPFTGKFRKDRFLKKVH